MWQTNGGEKPPFVPVHRLCPKGAIPLGTAFSPPGFRAGRRLWSRNSHSQLNKVLVKMLQNVAVFLRKIAKCPKGKGLCFYNIAKCSPETDRNLVFSGKKLYNQ